ncbi:hypothetical protein JCGZ_26513 [Jatropha curcas]|uniref:Uncharacterized protein n=1 Tax=Jatropha curcas TaxID=180498 RepID=A0A067JL09_JATCU|nr:hypothetical protein JCGZ_26513 [Jatropha curcas]
MKDLDRCKPKKKGHGHAISISPVPASVSPGRETCSSLRSTGTPVLASGSLEHARADRSNYDSHIDTPVSLLARPVPVSRSPGHARVMSNTPVPPPLLGFCRVTDFVLFFKGFML